MILTDSTRYRMYRGDCPRKRYWYTHYKGRGIVPAGPNFHTVYGSALHEGIQHLTEGWTFTRTFNTVIQHLDVLNLPLTPDGHAGVDEVSSLLWCHLKLFQDIILPKLLDEFEIIGVEQELVIPLSMEVSYMTRLDKMLKRKSDGLHFNVNYKSSSYLDDIFILNERNVQLLMEAEALRVATDRHIAGSYILAFDKGSFRKVTDAEQRRGLQGRRIISPFCYAYERNGQLSPGYAAGWNRVPVWLTPGLTTWWDLLTEDDKMKRWCLTPPMYHTVELIHAVKDQIAATEKFLSEYNEEDNDDLSLYFPQNLDNCRHDGGYIHHVCPYEECCFDGFVDIGGRYEWRTTNHPIEDTVL